MLELKKSKEMQNYEEMLWSDKPSYTEAPILNGSTLILFDVQVPYQDGEFILNMLKLAQAWGVRQGISGGDFFNEGAFSFFMYKPEERIWKAEAQKAKEVASAMLKFIPKWVMILGNHDASLLKLLAHQIGHQDMLRLADMPRAFGGTDYYWCIVKDKQENEWRVTHPRNVSVIHGRVPVRLANVYQQNIVAGHGHLASCSVSESGNYLCIDAGVVCEPEKLDYSQERDNLRPKMNKGAVILKEVKGKIYPYHILPEWADWDALKRLYS